MGRVGGKVHTWSFKDGKLERYSYAKGKYSSKKLIRKPGAKPKQVTLVTYDPLLLQQTYEWTDSTTVDYNIDGNYFIYIKNLKYKSNSTSNLAFWHWRWVRSIWNWKLIRSNERTDGELVLKRTTERECALMGDLLRNKMWYDFTEKIDAYKTQRDEKPIKYRDITDEEVSQWDNSPNKCRIVTPQQESNKTAQQSAT